MAVNSGLLVLLADPDLVRLPNVKAVPSECLWVLVHKEIAKNAWGR